MKKSPQIKTAFPTFATIFFISIFILFGIMEFRHTKNLINQYETGIKQITIKKTEVFQDNLKTVTVNIAKKLENEPETERLFKQIVSFDYRMTNLYLLKEDGTILTSASQNSQDPDIAKFVRQPTQLGNYQVLVSGVHVDSLSKLEVITMIVPLQKKFEDQKIFLAVNFRLDQYQNEIIQESMNQNFRIAVFDPSGNPVIWPFEKIKANAFDPQQETFYYDTLRYNIVASDAGYSPWRLYFFFEANNFELYRAIAILFLVFALYICLYELLVEFWGVNTAKTYFENIDFAIFNQINEGVIIANNSGRIIFANETAHHIFADRKDTLRNIKLKEIFGNTDDFQGENERATTLTLKFRDKLLKVIHSPIIKNNKILGSLSVIRTDVKEETVYHQVLNKLLEALSQGIIFVDKNHEIYLANFMAKCYLKNLIPGTSIEVIDRELATFIYNNIDSGITKRIELSRGLACEVTPVYDDDGIYVGTLVVLQNDVIPTGHSLS
ncbi:MAG: PAS domain-containing protein [Bacillota bacterium]